MPKPFILNDEQKLNSYGFKILTAGIQLSRFNSNPVMLDNHIQSTSAVIGAWKDIVTKDHLLSAIPNFDTEDENAKNIAGKVERGTIKGASMGISFSPEDLQMIDGELTLTKCELLEASIVAIPSNANALRLQVNGQWLTDTDVKTLCLSVAQDYKPNIKTTKNKMKKILLSIGAFQALGFGTVVSEVDAETINKAVLTLSQEKNALQLKADALQQKVHAFEQEQKNKQTQLAATLIDNALKSGQITADQKQDFVDLAIANFSLAEKTINALPKKKNFSTGVGSTGGATAVTTMDEFQKLSTAEQIAFRDADPEGYKAIVASV